MNDYVAIGRETLDILRHGEYRAESGEVVSLRERVAQSIATTTLRRHDATVWPPAPFVAGPAASAVEVTREPTAVAARRLTGHVGVLNFANGVTPGGGFLRGSRAQEEQLCRCSALYPCLTSSAAAPFYADQRAASVLGLDHVVISQDVVFFRDEDFRLFETPFAATVLTCAAPAMSEVHAAVSSRRAPPSILDAVEATLRRRAHAIVAAAHAAKVDALVLGAWGCGAFRNDPVIVADAFARALEHFAFTRVVFAIYRGPKENFDAFAQRFPA